jgi:putative redox protein
MTKTRVKWIEDKTFLGTDVNGQAALMSAGGDGPGVSPMQMLLLGLGGCSMVDVVSIPAETAPALVDVAIEFDAQRGEEGAKPWKTIHMHYIVTGETLTSARSSAPSSLSVEKYCGAHASLAGVANITHDFEIRDSG